MFAFIIILALTFSYHVLAQILELQQVVGILRDECWILDTNNLTAITMGNCQSSIYYVNAGLGTPPQFFNLQLDTSRGMPWLPLSSGFNYNQSQTFQITDQKDSTYIHENLCWGQVGSQVITIASTNISIRNSFVWTSDDMALPSQISGLLGMGYSDTPNFLDNAANQNQIQSSVFSLQIRPVTESSVLFYNQIPAEIWEATNFVENTGESTWQVDLHNFKVGHEDYSYIAPAHMIVDSTIDLIYFNNELYNKLANKYFKQCVSNFCPCDAEYPDFTFILDGVGVTVRSKNYMSVRKEGCFLLLGKTTYENSPMLVGTPLLKEYIVTFDKQNSRIGFNAPQLSPWPKVFLVLQFCLVGMISLTAALGGWLVFKVELPKKGSKGKSKSKNKSKKSKPTSLSMSFIEPE